jgi:2-C-methyl-D-erythritol 2,4-cyclodiphosphate synthase
MFRIGHGFDVHAFEPGDYVTIGGVRIAHSQGVKAHSDGDVLLHALCDALLGAAALGDIGRHFPDTDPRYAGVDSRVLLQRVMGLLQEHDYRVVNVDATVIAQAPRLTAYVPTMCVYIATDLGITLEQVNVKATTYERLGPVGRGEGLTAHAVVLIEDRET